MGIRLYFFILLNSIAKLALGNPANFYPNWAWLAVLFSKQILKYFKTDSKTWRFPFWMLLGWSRRRTPSNKQYSLRTDWLIPFSKLAAVFWNIQNWLKPFSKLAAVFWNNQNWLKPFSKLAAVFWNNQNWLKPFLKLAAVFNNLKTAASFGNPLSGK